MDYPRELSAQARARVEAERLRAVQEFRQSRSGPPPAEWKKTTRAWDECAFYAYILRVFRAYTHEACELGRQGIWTLDEIGSESNEFLRRFTINAHYEDGHDRSGQNFPDVTGSNWSGSLRSDLERFFHKSEAWRRYEAEVLAVAEEVGERGSKAAIDPSDKAEDISASTQAFSQNGDDPQFNVLAPRHPHVEAHWNNVLKHWIFRDRPLQPDGKPSLYNVMLASPEVTKIAKEAARVAVSRLRESRDPEIRELASTLREPLHVWLDLMRAKERGFRLIPQLRSWRGGKAIEQFQRFGTVPSDARITGNGFIPEFFKESAALWDDICALGFDTEVEKPSERAGSTDVEADARTAAQPTAPPGTSQHRVEKMPFLNVDFINAWMDEEGWINKTLAEKLHVSERAVSSMRNNGDYHGTEAITKLANLMGLDDVSELYAPEAST